MSRSKDQRVKQTRVAKSLYNMSCHKIRGGNQVMQEGL